MKPPVVLKIGGELLENPKHLEGVVESIAAVRTLVPLAVVHGGGREIDAALHAAGIEKRQVDGLRITDEATLAIAVSVLAGAVNTRFVAALGVAGVPAVGLTGADARCGLSVRASAHRTTGGANVDLGLVGEPSDRADVGLLRTLMQNTYVPVIACIGVDEQGHLLNVNADVLAAHLAQKLSATRLVMAGATAGLLDSDGTTIPVLEASSIAELIDRRTATAGMIAKLRACEHAIRGGVGEILIVDGRSGDSSTSSGSRRASRGDPIRTAMVGDAPAGATHIVAGSRVQV